MADQAASGARVCPQCQRRVPSTVSTCRCGAALPAGDADAAGDEASPSTPPWLVYSVLIAIVAGAAYWTFLRPPAATIVETPPGQAPPPGAGAPEPAGAAPPKRELSAEQRAWDAAARQAETTADPARRSAPVALTEPPLAPTGSLEDVVDAAMPAIVLVEATGGRGSAFFVAYDTLVTNVHVVQQDQYVTLRHMNGTTLSARVHTRAPHFDIAVLKVAQASPAQRSLALGTAQNLKPGQEVIVIGSALGTLQNSVSRGIVSGMRNSGGVTLIQSDAAANPGNSGGPMLDRHGRVIGILTAGMRNQQGLNFAVSIDHARDILEGRETNLGTGSSGLSNIVTSTPGGSESDRRQQQGQEIFLQRVDSAAQGAAQLDDAWRQFRTQCYKSPIGGSYDREWFAVYVPGAVPGDAAAGCVDYYQRMVGEMNRFREYMRSALGDARRANVLPGTIRDTLGSKRLNFDF